MSGYKRTPAWERVVTLDDHDALKRELAEERTLVGLMAETMDAQQDIIKRLAEALKQLLDYTLACELIIYDVEEQHNEHPVVAAARAALREAGVS